MYIDPHIIYNQLGGRGIIDLIIDWIQNRLYIKLINLLSYCPMYNSKLIGIHFSISSIFFIFTEKRDPQLYFNIIRQFQNFYENLSRPLESLL